VPHEKIPEVPELTALINDITEREKAFQQDRLTVEVPEGSHTVEIRKSGYRTYVTQVDVHRGQTTPPGIKAEITQVYSVDFDRPVHEIEAHRGAVRALTPLADAGNGRRLASCGVDCVVRVWDLDTFARTSEVRLANPKQDHAQLTHATIAGRALIAITVGAEVHLWDPAANHDPVQLGQPTDQIWSLTTTMVNGEVRIAGGGNDGRIHLWNPVTGELVRWFPAHQSTVWALASHNGGNSPLLASGAAAGPSARKPSLWNGAKYCESSRDH
jgi:WD40 repeat protein